MPWWESLIWFGVSAQWCHLLLSCMVRCEYNECNTFQQASQVWQRMGYHCLLRLGTPNSNLMDLVVFPFFPFILSAPMFLLSFHIMPHALLTSLIPMQCMAMPYFSPPPFCHRHVVASCFPSLPFHGHAWCTLLPHATRYRNILEHSLVDPVQIGTNICSSI